MGLVRYIGVNILINPHKYWAYSLQLCAITFHQLGSWKEYLSVQLAKTYAKILSQKFLISDSFSPEREFKIMLGPCGVLEEVLCA